MEVRLRGFQRLSSRPASPISECQDGLGFGVQSFQEVLGVSGGFLLEVMRSRVAFCSCDSSKVGCTWVDTLYSRGTLLLRYLLHLDSLTVRHARITKVILQHLWRFVSMCCTVVISKHTCNNIRQPAKDTSLRKNMLH